MVDSTEIFERGKGYPMSHFFITGHTGFKGAWATMLLSTLGHEVSGFALEPDEESLFNRADVGTKLSQDIRGDIRDQNQLISAMKTIKPDYVLHFAAQALVLEGYRQPRYTYETNVIGTLNVLEATAATDSVRAQLIVTTDKVYRNQGLSQTFCENDPLGGKDPYSASKAAADLLAQERLKSADSKPGAIARAGNVIGAGDYAKNRLLPDLVRAVQANTSIAVRSPKATRPWQHILDCLNGYLTLLQAIEIKDASGPWNFGPGATSSKSVSDVLEISKNIVNFTISRPDSASVNLAEEPFLSLDSSKARESLNWQDYIDLNTGIAWSLIEVLESKNFNLTHAIESQISQFLERREEGHWKHVGST